MSTYDLRQKFLTIARRDVGKVEESKNQAPWIRKFWPATNYPEGYANREPYCAAAMCYWLQQWLKDEEVLKALKLTPEKAEKWRCKSASVKGWVEWAEKTKGVEILPKKVILHAADICAFSYSHIEIVSNDDNTETGPFVDIGANTNSAGSRDGEGCHEKPRDRKQVQCFIRILQ